MPAFKESRFRCCRNSCQNRSSAIDAITGADLRRARQQQGVGLGQLADMINRSKGHLSKVERNVENRTVSPALIRDYQRALGVHVSATPVSDAQQQLPVGTVGGKSDQLDSNAVRESARVHELDGGVTGQLAPRSASIQSLDLGADGKVRRRKFLGDAGMAGLVLLSPQAYLLSGKRRIGMADVRRLIDRTARQRRLDDYLGGADTFQIFSVELEATKKLYREASYDSATGLALLGLVSEQAQQAGWAAFDAGDHIQAGRLYAESLSAAEEAQNRPLAGNAHAYLAYQKSSAGKSGVDQAKRSLETVGADAPAAVRALMLERLAWAHAVAQQPNEADGALCNARLALEEPEKELTPDWAMWVDRDEIQIMTGRCWTELRRPLRAVPVLTEVLRGFDDSHARDKALYLTWLASAYLDANEIENAVTVTRSAAELAIAVGSVRPQQRISSLCHRLAPHRRLPAVTTLLSELQEWLRIP